jgi:hypothetical protein
MHREIRFALLSALSSPESFFRVTQLAGGLPFVCLFDLIAVVLSPSIPSASSASPTKRVSLLLMLAVGHSPPRCTVLCLFSFLPPYPILFVSLRLHRRAVRRSMSLEIALHGADRSRSDIYRSSWLLHQILSSFFPF